MKLPFNACLVEITVYPATTMNTAVSVRMDIIEI